MKNIKIIFSIALMVFSLFACKEELEYDVAEEYAPVISSFSPSSGRVGDEILIEGEYLQAVDSVTIGGGSATIKYLINSGSMVVVVGSESKSGSVLVANEVGFSTSTSDFTKEYPVPVINDFPATSKAYETIVIEGEDLDIVTAVRFDTTQALIITQQSELLEVLVPFYRELTANIILTYPTESAEAEVASSSLFELEIVPPTITSFPTEAPDSTEIEISGEDLYLIDSVMFGDVEGTIVSQGDTILTVLVPKFNVTSTVELSLFYYGNEIILTDAFQVQVATLAYWSDKTIYSAMHNGSATTDSTFFNAVIGDFYSPCEWEEMKGNVHFFITVNDGEVRINAQDATGAQIDNFSCGGNALVTEKTPNTMRLKRLSSSDSDENDLITKVRNKTLEELNSIVLAELGIGNASLSYVETNHFLFSFEEGDVILFQQYNDDLSEVEYTGAMEVVELNLNDDKTEASIKFNAYFGAY
jgi:hypothetical protein